MLYQSCKTPPVRWMATMMVLYGLNHKHLEAELQAQISGLYPKRLPYQPSTHIEHFLVALNSLAYVDYVVHYIGSRWLYGIEPRISHRGIQTQQALPKTSDHQTQTTWRWRLHFTTLILVSEAVLSFAKFLGEATVAAVGGQGLSGYRLSQNCVLWLGDYWSGYVLGNIGRNCCALYF